MDRHQYRIFFHGHPQETILQTLLTFNIAIAEKMLMYYEGNIQLQI